MPLAENVTPGRASVGTFKHVEIQINTSCDCFCHGCDRFSDVISDPNMTVEQVRRFVDESISLEWRWDRIRLLGGEPTLHPQLLEIVEELMRYRRFHPKVFLQLLSNGLGKLDQTVWDETSLVVDRTKHPSLRGWLIDRGIDPHVEAKERGVTPSWFHNTRLAPIDRGELGPLEPCGIFGVHGCGIALTRHGYFLDGAGASVARVAGLDLGVMSLRDVTWEAMLEQSKHLCHLCGQWNPPSANPTLPETMATRKVTETGGVTGPFWTERIAAFQRQKPAMRVYGENP